MIKSLCGSTSEDTPDHQFSRNYEVVSIRQHNRKEHFQKKRKTHLEASQLFYSGNTDQQYHQIITQCLSETFHEGQLQELKADGTSDNVGRKYRAAIGLRKLVMANMDTLSKQLVEDGTVSIIASLASIFQYPQLILQATWCLTNITSASHLNWQALKPLGILDALITLITHSDGLSLQIFQHAVIALANIAPEVPEYRDQIIQKGCIESIIRRFTEMKEEPPDSIVENACWCISNICRCSPLPPYEKVQQGIKYLACIVGCLKDPDIRADCLYALVSHINIHNNNFSDILETDALSTIIHLCRQDFNHNRTIGAALRILGNLSAGDDWTINQMMRANLLQTLAETINHPKSKVRLDTCWILSNLAAGAKEHVHQMFEYPGLIQKIISLLNDDTLEIKKQICFIFANVSLRLDYKDYLEVLIEANIITTICELLQCHNENILTGILKCLGFILKHLSYEDTYFRTFRKLFDTHGGTTHLQQLQFSKNNQVYQLCSKIIVKYFEITNQTQEFDINSGTNIQKGQQLKATSTKNNDQYINSQ